MKEWVGFITNNFSWSSRRVDMSWNGIYRLDKESRAFSIEGEWTFHWETYKMIWTVAMRVTDIIEWRSHEYLIFWRDIQLSSIRGSFPFSPNYSDIWYLKTSTWLTEDEEKFLRLYERSSKETQQSERDKYSWLQEKIRENILKERERLGVLLNENKWLSGEIELF